MPREYKCEAKSIKSSSIAMEGVEFKCDALRHSQFVPSVVSALLDISTSIRFFLSSFSFFFFNYF